MVVQEKAFKDSIAMCLGIERKWLYIQRLMRHDLDEDSSLLLLQSLLMLMETLERSDTKVKLLQELMSSQDRADISEVDGDIDTATKSTVKYKCEDIAKKLAMGPRILSKPLTSDPFLAKFFYKEASIYDSPFCDTWRMQRTEEIKLQLQYWIHHLEPVWQAVEMTLWLVRAPVAYENINIDSGFYRKSGTNLLKLSLARVQYDAIDIYPVISISHRWLVINLYQGLWHEGSFQVKQLERPQTIGLALCR